MIELKHWNGRVIYVSDATDVAAALQEACNNKVVLRGSVLRGSVLRGSVLRGADLRGAYGSVWIDIAALRGGQ